MDPFIPIITSPHAHLRHSMTNQTMLLNSVGIDFVRAENNCCHLSSVQGPHLSASYSFLSSSCELSFTYLSQLAQQQLNDQIWTRRVAYWCAATASIWEEGVETSGAMSSVPPGTKDDLGKAGSEVGPWLDYVWNQTCATSNLAHFSGGSHIQADSGGSESHIEFFTVLSCGIDCVAARSGSRSSTSWPLTPAPAEGALPPFTKIGTVCRLGQTRRIVGGCCRQRGEALAGCEGAVLSRSTVRCLKCCRRRFPQAGLPNPNRMGAETAFQAYDRAYLRSREMAGAVLSDLRRCES